MMQVKAMKAKVIKDIKACIKQMMLGVYNTLYYILPLNKNVILFESSVGRNYTGNPKAIYEKMVAEELDKKYKCVWILEDTREEIPGRCIKIKRQRLKYFYYMSCAKFWVMDSRQPRYLKKKKGNVYIQTWHGTPLKKLGLDMSFVNMGGYQDIEEYIRIFKQNTSRWDYLISQNEYSTNIFKSAFAFNKEVLEIGYPRNDVLMNHTSAQVKAIREKLGLPSDKQILLYAPTWRDNDYDALGRYKFNLPIDLATFKQELGDKYYLLLKPHYLIADQISIAGYEDCVGLCNIKQDIQELYLVADALITDYSSVMFDYSILGRPIFFYMYDMEAYKSEVREFYFDILAEAPGPIVATNEELFKCLKNFEAHKVQYKEKYEAFKQKYTALDDGHAADKIVQLIERHSG